MKVLFSLITALLSLMSCSSAARQADADVLPLPDHLQVGQSVLSRDSITPVPYPVIDATQCSDLAKQSDLDFPDSTQFLGARSVTGKITLEAYKIPTREDSERFFKVYFLTRGKSQDVIDAINLGEFHTSEYQGQPRFGGNRFYTTDATVTFDGDSHFALHRLMTLTSIFLKNHRLTEMWRVEWDNRYEITEDGHFNFLGQQETYRTDDLVDPAIDEFKSRDLP